MVELLIEIVRSAGFIAGICGIATLIGVFILITLAEYGVRAAWHVLDWIGKPKKRSSNTFSLELQASSSPSRRG